MVKPLTFKGDKKPKKRKRAVNDDDTGREVKAAKPSADTVDVEPEADDSWVSADVPSDISGPVMLVLPTEPPSALACDANGKVFTIVIENIIDGNPSSAEPHDVRQVWVANKIPGTEHFRLKGHHGKWVSPSINPISPSSFSHHSADVATADTSPATRSAY
jgi:FRG1-like family.